MQRLHVLYDNDMEVHGLHTECGEGWYPLVLQCHNELLALDPDYRPAQIKEKFGTLRFYFDTKEGLWDEMQAIVTKHEKMSAVTCEVCGEPGVLCNPRGYWYKTLCAEHEALRKTPGK